MERSKGRAQRARRRGVARYRRIVSNTSALRASAGDAGLLYIEFAQYASCGYRTSLPVANDSEPNRRWWQTLPGALTALAGLITAITGLIVAVNQVGPWSDDNSAAPDVVAASGADRNVTTANVPGTTKKQTDGGASIYRVSFPEGAKATLGDSVYEIVGSRVERRNPGELTLGLTVRMTNNGDYADNLWSSTFRLLVNGLGRAPVNFLDDLVDGGTSKDGPVIFAVPESVRSVELKLRHADKVVSLPIQLREVAPNRS
jgi:hypothetical protein